MKLFKFLQKFLPVVSANRTATFLRPFIFGMVLGIATGLYFAVANPVAFLDLFANCESLDILVDPFYYGGVE